MIIVGAKGFAKEILEIFNQRNELDNLFFYDDVTDFEIPELYSRFKILRNLNQAKDVFMMDNRFTIGIGNPTLRYELYQKFIEIGGVFTSTISPNIEMGSFGVNVGDGCNIMSGTIITNDITIGKGCLINLNCTVGHDSVVGEFVEMSPGVHISGNCKIGAFCTLGTNSTVLPKVKLGERVIVGAGAVVTKDVPDNATVVGVPAKPLVR